MLVALERGKLRLLFIAFDLMASDLPLRVAFPILFHNTIEWFQPQRVEFPSHNVEAGTPFLLRLPVGDNDLQITTPTGKREQLKVATSPLVFTDTLEAGLYSYKSASREGRFAVNLLDESESQITSRLNMSVANAGARGQEGPGATASGFSLWPLLLGGVLILLALEFFLAFRAGVSLYPIVARGWRWRRLFWRW